MNRWDRRLAERTRDWDELGDDAYQARFEKLSVVYPPAVAAVMAHSVTAGPGAKTRIRS